MPDSGSIAIGGFACILGLMFMAQWVNARKTGKPISFKVPLVEAESNGKQTLEVPVTFSQMLAAVGFTSGLGIAVMGFGAGWKHTDTGIPIAIICFIYLFISAFVRIYMAEKSYRNARNIRSEKKSSPVSWLIFLIIFGSVLWTINDLYEKRQNNMLQTIDGFVQAVKEERFATAWQLYRPSVQAKYPLEKFTQNVISSRFNEMEMIGKELHKPYKGRLGTLGMLMKTKAGNLKQFSLVFGGLETGHVDLFEPQYYILRFNHNTPRIKRGFAYFLKTMKNNDFKTARRMAFIWEKDTNGDKSLLSMENLKIRLKNFGVLQGELEYPEPEELDANANFVQRISVLNLDGSQHFVWFKGYVNRADPGPGGGLVILGVWR